MTELIHWREPLYLLLALIPSFFWLRKTASSSRHAFKGYADTHLLPLLVHNTAPPKLPVIILSMAWVSACIALAGPYTLDNDQSAMQREAIDIALVVDISPSMSAADISPDRLQRGLWELDRLVQRRGNDRFALITFSANAYITLPLTYDKNAIRHFLSSLDTELPKRKGSNLGRALELAHKVLANSQANSRAIILLTDGEAHTNNNLGLAYQLGEQDIPLLIGGVGTTNGAPVKNSQGRFIYQDGKPVISKLHPLELNALAQASNGIYTELSHHNSTLSSIETRLNDMPALNRYQTDSRYTQPLFPWFLLISLLLLSFLTLKRAPLFALLIIIPSLLPSQNSLADDTSSRAFYALQQGNYPLAEKLYAQAKSRYTSSLGRGAIAYRQQHWQDAIDFFNNALRVAENDHDRAIAAYNLGNSYAQTNQLDLARQAFEKALRFRKGYPRASHNLNLVNTTLAQRQRQNKGQGRHNQMTATPFSQTNEQTTQSSSPQSDTEPSQSQSQTPTFATLNGKIETSHQHAPQGVNLDNLNEDTRTLLKKRFAKQDHIDQLNRIEDTPW